MHVIFGKQQRDVLGDKFTLLELDTIMEDGLESPVTLYAVISGEELAVDEIHLLDNHSRLHNDMLKEYKQRNWSYCYQALEHLKGKWRNQLDSFYDIFETRIKELENKDLPEEWDGTIRR